MPTRCASSRRRRAEDGPRRTEKATAAIKQHTTVVGDSAEEIKKAAAAHDKLTDAILKAQKASSEFAKSAVEDMEKHMAESALRDFEMQMGLVTPETAKVVPAEKEMGPAQQQT